jgi:hypothetical protein
MLNQTNKVSSKMFTVRIDMWKKYVFSTFISDLGRSFHFTRVYNDSCDEGLTIVSSKTGKEVTFAINKVDKSEGDIRYWELLPVKESIQRVPAAKNCKVLIFND